MKIDHQKVLDILRASKSLKEAQQSILDLVESRQKNNVADTVDENGEYFCRLHNRLEPFANMLLDSYGRPKGVCKAANTVWQRNYRQLKKLRSQYADAATLEDFQIAKDIERKIKYYERKLNSVDSYDYERDWKEYLSK
jgi:hypothetical protein